MCMKNVSTDITLFSNIDMLQEDAVTIQGINRKTPTVPVTRIEDGILGIDTISFLFCINAIERKDNPIHDEGDTPQNTVFFDNRYEVCLRLTEPRSGKFVDLGTYDFQPDEDATVLCRKIFDKKMFCQYHNVSVAEPSGGEKLCVLKVLIRLCNSTSNWIVQSMHPIRMILADS